jgi:hypothetical protein
MAGATREAAGLHQYLSVIDVAPIIAASGIVSNPVVSQIHRNSKVVVFCDRAILGDTWQCLAITDRTFVFTWIQSLQPLRFDLFCSFY